MTIVHSEIQTTLTGDFICVYPLKPQLSDHIVQYDFVINIFIHMLCNFGLILLTTTSNLRCSLSLHVTYNNHHVLTIVYIVINIK